MGLISSRVVASHGVTAILLTVALAICAVTYLAVLAKGVLIHPIVLIHQTETWIGFSKNEHFAWGYLLYGALCIALLIATFTVRRRDAIPLISLLVALLLVFNEDSGGIFEVVSMLPGVPQSGEAFNRFHNEWRVTEHIWHFFLLVIVIGIAWCSYGLLKRRRMRA